DVEVDAVEQRTGEPHLIVGRAARARTTLAGKPRLVCPPAAARVLGGYQHEPRRIGHAMICPRDCDFPGLKRLPQRIECVRLEFRQLVEEEDPMMCKRYFAGSSAQATAHQRRHAGRMVRRSKGPPIGERSALDLTRDRSDY